MKTLLILLISLITLNCFSQYQPEKKVHKGTLIALYTGSIVLNAIGDGLNDSNRKTAGHICNAISIGSLLSVPLLTNTNKKKWWVYPLSYGFMRFGLFSPVYNKTRSLPINYVGNYALDDKLYKAMRQQPMLFERGVSLIIGIALPLNQL